MGLKAYSDMTKSTETPRQQEQRLFILMNEQLVSLRDADRSPNEMIAVLHRNRAMWRAFADACSTSGNQLMPETRASIISLALWVDRHTSDIMRGEGSIEDLISVNDDMIAGLADP